MFTIHLSTVRDPMVIEFVTPESKDIESHEAVRYKTKYMKENSKVEAQTLHRVDRGRRDQSSLWWAAIQICSWGAPVALWIQLPTCLEDIMLSPK